VPVDHHFHSLLFFGFSRLPLKKGTVIVSREGGQPYKKQFVKAVEMLKIVGR
jgi:hypothetical protein